MQPVLTTTSEVPHRRMNQQYSPANLNLSTKSPRQQMPHQHFLSPDTPISSVHRSLHDGRHLPSREVTDENFDDTYAEFIIYCNPAIPEDTDTTELKKIFRAPPKSDGNNFNTFTLFNLIKKLETKEIKTWAQLVLDLGVEAPSAEKGQSAQKVQQYAVRLKV